MYRNNSCSRENTKYTGREHR